MQWVLLRLRQRRPTQRRIHWIGDLGLFLLRAECLADLLPDSCGALVFLLDPQRIDDTAGFGSEPSRFWPTRPRSRWLKFMVLDDRG